jgi:hypothetical protein
MSPTTLLAPLRWLGFVVLAALVAAVVYAGYSALANWNGIAV